MLDFMSELLNKFASIILNVLPSSPVQRYLAAFDNMPYLKYLNWFIPVGSILVVCETWLVCIGLFYLYQIILRWVKAID